MPHPLPGLVGRDDECRRLATLVARTRAGRGGAVLLLGDPGLGKTSLLDVAAAEAAGTTVLRADGHEAEADLPYSTVQRLFLPLRDDVDALAPRLAGALRVATGLAEGTAPDPFLVALGVLDLLSAAGARGPLVCLVDDAHLVDAESLQVLAFVARRLAVEPVALVLAARDEHQVATRLAGVEKLAMTGLALEHAVGVLRAAVAGPLDPAAAAQIALATGGNPLALVELAGSLTGDELTHLGLDDTPIPIGPRLEAHYAQAFRSVDDDVQAWVLLAAAETTGSTSLTGAAARRLDLDAHALDRAEAAGLLRVGDRIRFRHPLVRSAVYAAAEGSRRRAAHRALAAAATELGRGSLATWHAARATVGPDADVADQLERAADVAASRGGFASRATMLLRAVELTSDPDLRDARRIAAAEAALGAGAAQLAARVVSEVERPDPHPVLQGRRLVLQAALALFEADGPALRSAPATLVAAADLFRDHDTALEQRALLRAFETAMTADRQVEGVTYSALGRRFCAAADRAGAEPGSPWAAILRGLGAVLRLPYAEGFPLAREAMDTVCALPDHQLIDFASTIASLGAYLWAEEQRDDALERALTAAQAAGALQQVDALCWVMSLAELTGGTVRRAVHWTSQVREVRAAMGWDAEQVVNGAVLAWTGAPREQVLAIAEGAADVGFGGVHAAAVAALGVRDVAEARYADALERLRPLVEDPFFQVTPTQYTDYVEAAARCGRHEEVARYAQVLLDLAAVNGSPWCRGVAERSAGLAALASVVERSDGGRDVTVDPEQHFLASIEALAPTRARVCLARTHLVYGEWLRRAKRRAEARKQLRTAVALLEETGAHIFLPRARAELEAVGDRPGAARVSPTLDLTPQELTVARLAAASRTNAEIGVALYISPNTVDYHLRKVFQKLGVTSRRQLADRLDSVGI